MQLTRYRYLVDREHDFNERSLCGKQARQVICHAQPYSSGPDQRGVEEANEVRRHHLSVVRSKLSSGRQPTDES
jgi:hypothetical protein